MRCGGVLKRVMERSLKRSIHHNSAMWSKGVAFLIWAAVAATGVFWGLRVGGQGPQPPAHARPAPTAVAASGDVTRVLGPELVAQASLVAAAPAAADQSRFQLLGVIAGGPSGSAGPAWATIAVDGKPARTFRLGGVVDGTNVLQKVAARGVEIGPRGGSPAVTLALSTLPAAATGRPNGLQGSGAGVVGAPAAFGPAAAPAGRSGTGSAAAEAAASPEPSAPGSEAAPAAAPGAPGAPSLRRPSALTR